MHYRTLVLAILSSICFAAKSTGETPGNRPDQGSWFTTLGSKILKLEESLRSADVQFKELKEELIAERSQKVSELQTEKSKANSFIGLPFIVDTKSDYEEEIYDVNSYYNSKINNISEKHTESVNNIKIELEYCLASPADKAVKAKMASVKPNTGSREALEVYNACKNLQSIAQKQIAQLETEPSNYELAEETYIIQGNLCKYVITMNSLFHARIDSEYIPTINNLIKSAESIKRDAVRNERVDQNIALSEKEKMEKIQKALSDAISQLAIMKVEVRERIDQLKSYDETISLMKRSAGVAKDSSAIISTINQQFAQLDIPMPELISYDLQESDFTLNN